MLRRVRGLLGKEPVLGVAPLDEALDEAVAGLVADVGHRLALPVVLALVAQAEGTGTRVAGEVDGELEVVLGAHGA